MQDGFGAINIAVAFSQIIAIFRQLDLQWPDELLDMFNMISLFNLNVDLLSIDCFVDEWSFTRKFFLANLIPVLFGLTFLIRTLMTVFHNTFFLPKVYIPLANRYSRFHNDIFLPKIYEPITERYSRFHNGVFIPAVYKPAKKSCYAFHHRVLLPKVYKPGKKLYARAMRSIRQQKSIITSGDDAETTAPATPMRQFPSSPTSPRPEDENNNVGGGSIESHAVVSSPAGGVVSGGGSGSRSGSDLGSSSAMPGIGRRLTTLARQVTTPIKRQLSKTSSEMLSEVDEEDAGAFSRRMQCAFLLFLSWAYMALASINVEYYNCQQAGEGRMVLVIDPTVECWTGTHLAMWPMAMMGTACWRGAEVVHACIHSLNSFPSFIHSLRSIEFIHSFRFSHNVSLQNVSGPCAPGLRDSGSLHPHHVLPQEAALRARSHRARTSRASRQGKRHTRPISSFRTRTAYLLL